MPKVLGPLIAGLGIMALDCPAAAAGRGGEPAVVFNAGRPGDTTRDLAARLPRDVLARAPAAVVLMVGTNDALNHAKAVPLPEFRRNLARLLERIRGAGAQALLLTIPPCWPPFLLERHPKEFFGAAGPNAAVERYNRAIKQAAAEQQIPLVDVHRLFARLGHVGTGRESLIRNPANSGARDGVHPTAEGYRLIATAVYQALADHGLARGRIVCFGDSITYGIGVPGAGAAAGQTWPGFLARLLSGD